MFKISMLQNYYRIPYNISTLLLQSPSFLGVLVASWDQWVEGSPIDIWENKVKRIKRHQNLAKQWEINK